MAEVITALDDSAIDDGGWNCDGSGNISIGLFGNAIQVWAVAQDRPVTVQEAAVAFNTTPAIIRQAVESHYWMFLSGDIIEHDGE